jgi:uncharacterized protein (DUF433 family)
MNQRVMTWSQVGNASRTGPPTIVYSVRRPTTLATYTSRPEEFNLDSASASSMELKPEGVRVLQLGHYIVADPEICHGQPTFRGTRILVADVLEQLGLGMDWDSISREWRGRVTREAIAEAINLARSSLHISSR